MDRREWEVRGEGARNGRRGEGVNRGREAK